MRAIRIWLKIIVVQRIAFFQGIAKQAKSALDVVDIQDAVHR